MVSKKIDIKVSFNCNNKCKFCVQGNKRKLYKNKSTGEIKTILKNSSFRCTGIVFTGGEPTLRNDICELTSFAKSLQLKQIQIQTNGRMFAYQDFCSRIIDSGANEFSPAIHGHSEKIHDFLTTSPGSFRQTVQGIKNLKQLGQYVLTNTVITNKNYKSLPMLAKLLVGLGVNQFQFAFPHILGSAQDNKNWLIPRKSSVIDYVKRSLEIGKDAGVVALVEGIPYCLMGEYKDCIAEKIIPKTKVFDADFVIENYSNYRKRFGKAKHARCKECAYDSVCEGPWKEYPELFGWGEFIPI